MELLARASRSCPYVLKSTSETLALAVKNQIKNQELKTKNN